MTASFNCVLRLLSCVALSLGVFLASESLVMGQDGGVLGESQGEPVVGAARRPANDDELAYWLGNMVRDHHFSREEIEAATGLTAKEIDRAIGRLGLDQPQVPSDASKAVKIRPYPGGRHPRIGFLDGAVRPQRETKFSAFLPWDQTGYVVADIPEAIWSNLGLTYLAHTHIDTIWDTRNVELKPLEWHRDGDDHLWLERTLPNGITFGSEVQVDGERILMRMWLHNGTEQKLTDLRVQNCIMLKSAQGFAQQIEENKRVRESYVACQNPAGDRWIITAWEPLHRAWGNPPCPCLHSDPRFPDCEPGETKTLTGVLTFHEGTDIDAALAGLEESDWRTVWEDKPLPDGAAKK